MKQILKIAATDGSDIYIEVKEDAGNETVTRSSSGEPGTRGIIQDAKESFDKMLKPLREVSNSIINCIKDISNSPEEIQVELGLKFSAKTGIIITSLDSEAHLKVIFKWSNTSTKNN